MNKTDISEYNSISNIDIDMLSEIYSSVDIFATVMSTLDEILCEAINLYEEIETLTIEKSILQKQLSENNYREIYIDIENISNLLSEKQKSLDIILGNARSFAKII